MNHHIENYVSIGHGEMEFIPPSTFEGVTIKTISEQSAMSIFGSKTYDAGINIISEIYPADYKINSSTNLSASMEAIRSVPFKTIFGKSELHFASVEFMPGFITHEFSTVIETPDLFLMITCHTNSSIKEEINSLENILIDSFRTIREVKK